MTLVSWKMMSRRVSYLIFSRIFSQTKETRKKWKESIRQWILWMSTFWCFQEGRKHKIRRGIRHPCKRDCETGCPSITNETKLVDFKKTLEDAFFSLKVDYTMFNARQLGPKVSANSICGLQAHKHVGNILLLNGMSVTSRVVSWLPILHCFSKNTTGLQLTGHGQYYGLCSRDWQRS